MTKFIGDLHLGKQFLNGVALDRRGEREAQVFEKAIEQLTNSNEPVIQVGDVFDKARVPLELVVEFVARLAHVKHSVYMIAGNHDLSKSTSKISSFELAGMLNRNPNVHFVTEPTSVGNILLLPYNPLGFVVPSVQKHEIVCTHEDVEVLQKHSADLSRVANRIVNGHIHEPSTHGVIENVGSIEPFSHGEDPNCDIYITLTPEKIHSHNLSNMCVRILLKKGEVFDEQIDCRQLTFKRIQDEEIENIEVDLDNFDMKELMRGALKETKMFNRIWEMFENA